LCHLQVGKTALYIHFFHIALRTKWHFELSDITISLGYIIIYIYLLTSLTKWTAKSTRWGEV